MPGYEGTTPLHYAAYSGKASLVKQLIMIEKLHCNYNSQALDNFGRTSIMVAVNSLPCLQYLCDNECDPTSRTNINSTLLHFAAQDGSQEIVDYLVKEGYFDPDTPGWTNRVPVHCAADRGHLEVLRHLITEYDCQTTSTDVNGDTPLHFAAA